MKEHARYFSILINDLVQIAEFVEPSRKNYNVFSIRNTKFLLTVCSEVDVVLNILYRFLGGNKSEPNMSDYKAILMKTKPKIRNEKVHFPKWGIKVRPFSEWSKKTPTPLSWWRDYNKVKHERHLHYRDAKLSNCLRSIGALLIVLFYANKERMIRDSKNTVKDKDVTRDLKLNDDVICLDGDRYYAHIIA